MKAHLESLSPGARRLLKLFEWFWVTHGSEGCWPRLSFIASRLKTSERSVCRWSAELASRGVLHKTRRGPHSNLYTSRGHIRCSQLTLPGMEERSGTVSFGESFGESFPVVSINELPELKEDLAREPEPVIRSPIPNPSQARLPETLAELEAATAAGTYSLAEAPSQPISTAPVKPDETAVIVAAVEEYRYADGLKPDSRQIAPRLIKIGKFYGVSGYAIAAKLQSARRQVERSPSTTPQASAWFITVVESYCKRRKSGWPAKSCGVRPPDKRPEYPPGDYCPEFGASLIQGLVATKAIAEKGRAA